MKVKDLIQFEEIKRVIDIDLDLRTADGSRELIEKYIITTDLRGHLKDIAENLSKPKHDSYQIIGNYGSGKSHLLGFLAALVDNPELVQHIHDEEIRAVFTNYLQRRFAVVQFELQPSRLSLMDFFYDRVEAKLTEKYGITIPPIDPGQIIDHKEKIREILNTIKSHDPQMGLIVVVDEISDFLKQKESVEMKNRDTQFMRVLGQASNAMDFIFIGSMQENIFRSNEFVEESESFGRTSQRFKIITISKEDIKNVLAKRALRKDYSQVEDLKDLLGEYGQQIPQVQNKLNQFIDLYPVHPYILDIFSQLPYFATRGVIEFTVEQVKEILNEDFPQFITFEKIYDKIVSNHNVKTLDEVSPVINAVETLFSKIDLLRENMRDDATRLVKALAVLKLYGKTLNNGANPEELATELMIITDKFSNTDRIKLVLTKLREVTDGQFISKTENDYYYIDLDHGVDYDVVIERKSENLFDGAEDEELLKILKHHFELYADNDHERVFADYSNWKDKKSFRVGSFVYDDGSSNVRKGEGDFNFVFVSPYKEKSAIGSATDTAVLKLEYDEILDGLLKKIAAITSLKRSSSYPKNILEKKQKEYVGQAEKRLLKLLLTTYIKISGDYVKVDHLLAQESDNLAEYFYEVKASLFSKVFTSKYSEYPTLLNRLSPDNVVGEVERTLKEIFRGGEEIQVSNSQNLLTALELLDSKNYLDTKPSHFAKIILQDLKEQEGKNVKVEAIVERLAQKPFGLDAELVYLVLIVLTYNGEINMKKRGGGTITASELGQFFASGLNKFNEVPYVTLETEFPVEQVIELFKILELPFGAVRQQSERPEAVRIFRNKVLELQEQIRKVDERLNRLRTRPNEFLDLNSLILKREGLNNIPMDKFLKVKTVPDFRSVVLDEFEIERLQIGLKFLTNISDFLEDFESTIYQAYTYVVGSLKFIKDHSKFFAESDVEELEEQAHECSKIMNDFSILLSYDERRILRGKMEQYQRKYSDFYYRQHRQSVGQDVNWDKLDEIKANTELRRLNYLKNVRGINTRELNRLVMVINKLEHVRCDRLSIDHLQDNFQCPFCSFPKYDEEELVDINHTLDEIWNQIYDIRDEWQKQIINEIENYQDNIGLLASAEQEIVKGIVTEQRLPEVLDQKVITALNNLFSELEEVEISATDIAKIIFAEHGVLDYTMFVQKLEQIRDWVLQQGDRENIRIKLKERE